MKINYTKQGDYLIPNLELESKENKNINKYGHILLNYLKQNRKTFYQELLMKDELNNYLFSVGNDIQSKVECLIKLLAEKENVDEELKETNQLLWIQRMNNIKNQAEEIILNEIIYQNNMY